MTKRSVRVLFALWVGLAFATAATAQPIQKDTVGTAFSGKLTKVDGKAKLIHVQGANGEKGVFHVGDDTTIMSSDEKVALSALHVGDWIVIDANTTLKGRKVANYIEVVEDATGDGGKSGSMATADGATVEVRHNKLNPSVVQIRAGQSVTFHNLDKMPGGHTVMAPDGSFSSPALDKGQKWSHIFDVPGVYAVKIKEHPGAEASIVVEAPE